MNLHNLRFDRMFWLESVCILPWILAMIPIPLAVPVCFIAMIFDPANRNDGIILCSIYFPWLAIGGILIWLNERGNKK